MLSAHAGGIGTVLCDCAERQSMPGHSPAASIDSPGQHEMQWRSWLNTREIISPVPSELRRRPSLLGRMVARAVLCGVALGVLPSPSIPADAHAQPRRILLLHSAGHPLSPWSDIAASFRKSMVERAPWPVEVYEASFDVSRYDGHPEEEPPLVDYLRSLFAQRNFDLVVPVAVPATDFVQRHRANLFHTVPMLTIGAAEGRIPKESLGDIDAIVATKVDLDAYFKNVFDVLPDTRTIAIVGGSSPPERYWVEQFRQRAQAYRGRADFVWLDDLPFNDMLARARALPPRSVVFDLLFAIDKNGVPFPQDRALDELRATASVPIFGICDYQLGRGIVGGALCQTRALGQTAADVAIRILQGEAPGSIHVAPVPFALAYDARELQRWRISEDRLPAGSDVQFREPSLWVQYLWQLAVLGVALASQGCLIGWLLVERGRRRNAEAEAHHRLSELARLNRRATVGELSASIAHEINQPLAAIVASGNAGLHWMASQPPNLDETNALLARIVSDGHRAAEIIRSLREMFKGVPPARELLDINHVIVRVLSFLQHELDGEKVTVRLDLADGLPPIRAERIQLKQVIMNLVLNGVEAMEQSDPHERKLVIHSSLDNDGVIAVTIQDRGPGIAPQDLQRVFEPFVTTKPGGMGMGLSICRTIIEAHGGSLCATSGPGPGATLRIVLPVAEAEAKIRGK
jgi:signal transduction histidine kinase